MALDVPRLSWAAGEVDHHPLAEQNGHLNFVGIDHDTGYFGGSPWNRTKLASFLRPVERTRLADLLDRTSWGWSAAKAQAHVAIRRPVAERASVCGIDVVGSILVGALGLARRRSIGRQTSVWEVYSDERIPSTEGLAYRKGMRSGIVERASPRAIRSTGPAAGSTAGASKCAASRSARRIR